MCIFRALEEKVDMSYVYVQLLWKFKDSFNEFPNLGHWVRVFGVFISQERKNSICVEFREIVMNQHWKRAGTVGKG